jgi:LysR family hydrogen peroxide-inducible transcriptional activator
MDRLLPRLHNVEMEIEQLRQFLKVAEHGSFTRAAEDLRITQPALSRAVAKLEEEFGQPVFERQTRRLSLTMARKLLVARAQQIVSLIEDTKAEITDNGRTGRLRIAAIPTIAPYFLPAQLQKFGQMFPGAHLIVREDTTDNVLKAVADGVVDIAILALPIEAKYLEIEALFEEELLLLLSASHPLTAKANIL